MDHFDGASEAPSGAFTEGSWGDRSDRELYQVLEDPLFPEQSLPVLERHVLRASATLTLRRQVVAPGVADRALMGARIRDAARNDPRGVVAYLECRLAGELEVPSDSNVVVDTLVNMCRRIGRRHVCAARAVGASLCMAVALLRVGHVSVM